MFEPAPVAASMAIKKPRAIAGALVFEPQRSGGWRARDFFVFPRGMAAPLLIGAARGKKWRARRCAGGDRGEAGPVARSGHQSRDGRWINTEENNLATIDIRCRAQTRDVARLTSRFGKRQANNLGEHPTRYASCADGRRGGRVRTMRSINALAFIPRRSRVRSSPLHKGRRCSIARA